MRLFRELRVSVTGLLVFLVILTLSAVVGWLKCP
jgi:hypothetical protein